MTQEKRPRGRPLATGKYKTRAQLAKAIARYRAQGYTQEWIAIEVNVAVNTVKSIINEMNRPRG